MTRTIIIGNQKGGVGKSTTTVNLAAALAERGRRVLVIDLDPQGSSSLSFGVREMDRSLFASLTDGVPLDVRETSVPNVGLVSASPWLMGADKALASEVGAENLLRGLIPPGWSYILLDTPPNLGVLTVNALVAATEALVPVETQAASLAGIARFMQTIGVVRERLNPHLRVCGIVACKAQMRTRHTQEVIEALRKMHPDLLLDSVIRYSVKFAEAWSYQQPITMYEPGGNGAADYRQLAGEIDDQKAGA